MKLLTIFYDPYCGLCANFKKWITAQPAYVVLEFVPYDSSDAERLCPGIRDMKADQEIVVLADDGQLWQGPPAWITCLWALREYRVWAFRLATPTFLPLVRKACHLISENRLRLSQLLKLRSQKDIVRDINETPLECESGVCAIPALKEDQIILRREHRNRNIERTDEPVPPKIY